MNQKPVKITALSVEELAQLLSQAGRKAISEQDVLAIAEAAGIVRQGSMINLIEYTAFLAREVAGGAD
ncbi:MAG TPA: hypothetical protein PLB76_12655 [Anaerohalosphaeraceae bacterium]|jgi:hypothetical protein|nr:hypothetical protein [Anaerohalosphaeraceae bacterium]HQG07097.1 hypothetical protein [Anaerohalosphaeraceae bacterium]